MVSSGSELPEAPLSSPVQVRDSTGALITDAVALANGREHACAVRMNGNVWCWGANANGQLGNGVALGTMPPPVPSPVAVQVVTTVGTPLTGIVEMAAGDRHSCGRDGTGKVWCWGDNTNAQLGDGTTTARSTAAPVLVAPAGVPFVGAVDLASGAAHVCMHDASNQVWCWGESGGQVPDGTGLQRANPVMVGASASYATGQFHTCLVNADSTISCAGWNGHARLGIGTGTGFSDGNHAMLAAVLATPGGSSLTGAAQVAAGGESCAVMLDTSVLCWGDDGYGQVGTGLARPHPRRCCGWTGRPSQTLLR